MSTKFDGDRGVTFPDNTTQGTAAYLPNRNKIMNGAMRIVQRGTSFSIAAGTSAYVLDRWFIQNTTNQTATITQSSLSNFLGSDLQNALRIVFATAPTSGQLYVSQRIEGVDTLAGGSATFSAYAASAETSLNLNATLNQNFGSSGSATVTTPAVAIPITAAAMSPIGATFTVPSVVGKVIGSNHFLELSMALPIRSTNPVQLTLVQLEAGTSSTPFDWREPGDELRRCQRYYFKILAPAAPACGTTTGWAATFPFPTTMRAASTASTNIVGANYVAGAPSAGTGQWDLQIAGSQYCGSSAAMTVSALGGLTAGYIRGYGSTLTPAPDFFETGSGAYIDFSAEL